MANCHDCRNSYLRIYYDQYMEQQSLQESIQLIKNRIKLTPRVAIILGSGLGSFGDELSDKEIINCQDIPHYPVPRVAGHAGVWIFGKLENIPILALKGRVHTYEGYSAREVTYSCWLNWELIDWSLPMRRARSIEILSQGI